jgi:hypothetical protein
MERPNLEVVFCSSREKLRKDKNGTEGAKSYLTAVEKLIMVTRITVFIGSK